MVPQFLQALFNKNASARVRSASPSSANKEGWDAQYDQYVPPTATPREMKDAGYGAGPETRRWLVEMWMETLPVALRPLHLFENYEQIAFTIALNWGEQRELKRYMQQLIFSSDNARWCFAPDTFPELVRLDRYIDEMHDVGFGVQPSLEIQESASL
jgi:hypothetical protein